MKELKTTVPTVKSPQQLASVPTTIAEMITGDSHLGLAGPEFEVSAVSMPAA